ncbi:MAG: hypothetical protein GX963_08790 [Bacteroidales bacterium]|nr:hypothetical protein [Bacteroidales bacterium]
MNLEEIKKISIASYLQSIGCEIRENRNYYGMYQSPYRSDTQASLKVDYGKNLWHDFGTGEGGSIIDLVMKVQNCNFKKALEYLQKEGFTKTSFSFHRNIFHEKRKSPLVIISVLPISSKGLIQYLHSRRIPLEVATNYCKEVHFQIGEKPYYSIGFKNDSDGYILRNKFCKQCTSSDITTFQFFDNCYNECLVFEGFFDFLSYLTLQDIKKIKTNTAVLNSVTNINKALPFLKKHKKVLTYFDNDDAGKKATLLIQKNDLSLHDKSSLYLGYNDLNEFLIKMKI